MPLPRHPFGSVKDRADAGEWLSGKCADNRFLGWLVLGSPRVRRVHFQVAATPADDLPDTVWATFKGDRWAPPLPIPRFYRTVGVMGVDLEAMMELEAVLRVTDPNAQPAVGFRFGPYVMAAITGQDHTARMALRRGHDPLDATAGYFNEETRDFHAAGTAAFALGTSSVRAALDQKIPVF
ncbi:MAG TPA: hypothetical protein VLE99_03085 [Candidatus Saccharimonadales bacterium]|nr:hypothetical protein [Candidatus Saccharimonadales bacterium]